MFKFRATFFQTLLIILSLAFVLAVRFVQHTESSQAGSFAGKAAHGNLTVAEVFAEMSGEG